MASIGQAPQKGKSSVATEVERILEDSRLKALRAYSTVLQLCADALIADNPRYQMDALAFEAAAVEIRKHFLLVRRMTEAAVADVEADAPSPLAIMPEREN